MQADFHYYCVAVLARAAGFTPQDALTIAFASQYVDNAVEGAPIKVGVQGFRFDPVRTAPLLVPKYFFDKELVPTIIEALKGNAAFLSWTAQKRVQIAFHFIPPKPIGYYAGQNKLEFDFRVAPNSPFARQVLAHAARTPHPKTRLCAIGIALHAYADTWTHQGFSGRRHFENNVDRLWVWDEDKKDMQKADKLTQHLERLFPNWSEPNLVEIGHTEAFSLPDLSYVKWEYENLDFPAPGSSRQNYDLFLAAARKIYLWLKRLSKPGGGSQIPWSRLDQPLMKLFRQDGESHKHLTNPWFLDKELNQRIGNWKKEFASLFKGHDYHYDFRAWREAALPEHKAQLDFEMLSYEDFDKLDFPKADPKVFWDSLFVHFHRAALRQRYFVVQNLI